MLDLRAWIAKQVLKSCSYSLFGKERVAANAVERRELRERVVAAFAHTKVLKFMPRGDWRRHPHRPQALFMQTQEAQLRAFVAANQVGKTWALGAEVLSWCLGQYPWSGKPVVFPNGRKWQPGMRFMIAGTDFVNSLAEDIVPKLKDLLPLVEIGCVFEKVQGRVLSKITFPHPFESSIKLLSYEMDPSKWEGYTWDGIAFNEPPPKYAYIASVRGCMKNGAPIVFALTPLDEPYLYDEIYTSKLAIHVKEEADLERLKPDNYAIVSCDLSDTPYMTDQQKEIAVSRWDEDEREARVHGRFKHLMGRVYKNFDRAQHVLGTDKFFTDHPDWQKYPAFCVIDPHDRKPFAMAWGVVTPRDEKVFIQEWPDFDFTKVKQYKASIDEYVAIIRDTEARLWQTTTESVSYGFDPKNAPIAWRIMDPNFGRSPKAGGGRTVEEEFADRQLYFDTTVDDDIPSGHLVVRNAFATKQVFFLDCCNNLTRGAENYTWDEYRGKTDHTPKEKPRDKYKDFMDLVRYLIKTDPKYFTPTSILSGMVPQGHENGGMGRWRR